MCFVCFLVEVLFSLILPQIHWCLVCYCCDLVESRNSRLGLSKFYNFIDRYLRPQRLDSETGPRCCSSLLFDVAFT